jgi:hypothetical protein
MDYAVESFSEEERAALAPRFTNLDRPVFALVNLPETVKGSLCAIDSTRVRSSRPAVSQAHLASSRLDLAVFRHPGTVV